MIITGQQILAKGAVVHLWNMQRKHLVKVQYVASQTCSCLLLSTKHLLVGVRCYDHLCSHQFPSEDGCPAAIPTLACAQKDCHSPHVHRHKGHHCYDSVLPHISSALQSPSPPVLPERIPGARSLQRVPALTKHRHLVHMLVQYSFRHRISTTSS